MNRAIYYLLRFNHWLRRWLTQHLTPTGLGLLVALFVFGLIGLDIRRSVSYQIFAFLIALMIVAIALSQFTRYRIGAVRHLPRFGTVDVPFKYRIALHSYTKKRLAGLSLTESFANLFPSFQDFRELTWHQTTTQWKREWYGLLAQQRRALALPTVIAPLAANGTHEVTAELLPLRRGLLTFNKLTVACPEPLGIVNRCMTLVLPQTVLILPKRYQLPSLNLPGTRCYQSDGLAVAASVGDSEEFRALRDYRPGDSPRKIHWKSWAKMGKPIVKEEQSEYSVRHALVLDTFQTEGYSEVMEEAVAIAASLAYTIQTQESLLDLVFVSDQAHCFTAGRGLGQSERLLELLASVAPCQDQIFSSLLPVVRSRLALLSGCVCICLNWDRDRQDLVKQLQTANIPTLVLIVAPAEGLSEPVDRSCLQNAQSSLHILHLGKIQEELWTI
ncbi:DUF58 domain-containing protein [cf. Phormidesmis sp. LEGE 11477]|uniref:DUF58 domain-containing protein n=1 Tax=cf. Phormidesmis sp. LEGE 11477 TaxID=1828680 RepID=UPI00187FA11C|nr:DUF58 domain-containing protein [cf. Phormidesmis sp. LEGE 11477]MBE9063075.1 DUF58 domain-containing protein [cf. Phormidesmis sp. LEGE 11477]